jgi:hypothetical protein
VDRYDGHILQSLYNLKAVRYTLYTGEPIITGFMTLPEVSSPAQSSNLRRKKSTCGGVAKGANRSRGTTGRKRGLRSTGTGSSARTSSC